MKGLLLMTDDSCNKFRYRILNNNTFFFKERNIAKNDNGSFAYVVQFGVELKSLILIRLHSHLVVRTVRLCLSPFQQKRLYDI